MGQGGGLESSCHPVKLSLRGSERGTRGSGHVVHSSSGDLYAVLDLILHKGLMTDVGRLNEEGLIDQVGAEAHAVFWGTAEDLRRAAKALDAASPGEGDRRLDVAHYLLDVEV